MKIRKWGRRGICVMTALMLLGICGCKKEVVTVTSSLDGEEDAEYIEMKELETYGDEILRKAISDLFSGKYEALEVIKLRDIYKEIENSLDTCYHISDMILNIAFKQS